MVGRGLFLALPPLGLLGGGELVLRRHLALEWPFGIVRDDPELGWRLNPGWSGRFHGVNVSVTDAGLRDPRSRADLARLSEPILFIGDSVVMGYGVREEDSLPRRLETRVGRPVINAGVIGYGSLQEARLARRLLPTVRPRIILLGICLNDIAPNRQYRLRIAPKGRAARFAEVLREHSALFHAMKKRIHAIAKKLGQVKAERTDLSLPALDRLLAEDPEGALADFRRALEEFASLGVPVRLVLFPLREQMGPGAQVSPQERIGEAASEADLPLLDLLEPLRGCQDCFIDPCHLSPRGTGRAAAIIARWLEDAPP